MIGLSGAHRTGKTSLAKAYAEKHQVPFAVTSASQVFKDMGLDPSVTYDLTTRLDVQNAVLDACEKVYKAQNGIFITDRCPLDMIAYTMADIKGDTIGGNNRLIKEATDYIARCFDVMNKYFGIVIVVQPGIPIVAEPGKASLDPVYIEHLNSLCMGLSIDPRLKAMHFYIPRRLLTIEDRLSAVEFAERKGKQAALVEYTTHMDQAGLVH